MNTDEFKEYLKNETEFENFEDVYTKAYIEKDASIIKTVLNDAKNYYKNELVF